MPYEPYEQEGGVWLIEENNTIDRVFTTLLMNRSDHGSISTVLIDHWIERYKKGFCSDRAGEFEKKKDLEYCKVKFRITGTIELDNFGVFFEYITT